MVQLFLLFSEWALLILRLALGWTLFAHGLPKLRTLKQSMSHMHGVGFLSGRFLTAFSAVLETVGGAFLLTGLLTQPSALVLAVEMLIVLGWNVVRRHKLVGGYALTILLLAGLLTIAANGSVLFSVDGYFGILF